MEEKCCGYDDMVFEESTDVIPMDGKKITQWTVGWTCVKCGKKIAPMGDLKEDEHISVTVHTADGKEVLFPDKESR